MRAHLGFMLNTININVRSELLDITMSIQSLNNQITKGLVVAFDIFERKDIEKVNEVVSDTLDSRPDIKETHVSSMGTGLNAHVIHHTSWNIEPFSLFLKNLVNYCNEKGFKCDLNLLEKYVEKIRVEGYDSPYYPAYVLMISVSIKKDALDKSENLRNELSQIGYPLRLFVERFDGLSRYESGWTPRASVITQLWIKTSEKKLNRIRETALDLVKRQESAFEYAEQRIKISKSLRQLEPVDLSATVGDVHSYIIGAVNVLHILGHTHQLAMSGLRTPYILTLSYDDHIFPKDTLASMSRLDLGVPVYDIGDITWRGHSCLVYLLSLSMYLNYITSVRRIIDNELSNLRSQISTESPKHEIVQLNKQLTMISNIGTQISSALSQLGAFSREWEGSIRRLSTGRGSYAIEIPILPIDSLFLSTYTNFFASLNSKGGYLETLSKQILQRLKTNKESLGNQESEVGSIGKHITDFLNLETSRINLLMAKRVERLTWVTVILGILFTADTIALFNFSALSQYELIQYVAITLLALIIGGFYVSKK